MDKKTVIGLVLIGLIFLLWPYYMKKVVGVPDKPVQTKQEQVVQRDEPVLQESAATKKEEKRDSPTSEALQEVFPGKLPGGLLFLFPSGKRKLRIPYTLAW